MGFTSSRLTRASGTMEQMLIDRHALTRGAGVAVTPTAVAGLPAFDAGINFAANAVAQLAGGVWRGDGALRSRVATTWQARLFKGQPNPEQDWYQFWYIIEASRTARRNAYVWKTKSDGQVRYLTALHPDQVRPYRTTDGTRYVVTFGANHPRPPGVSGFGSVTVDASVVRHIRGPGGIGDVIAPSPIDAFKASLGLAVAKVAHEESIYRNGAQGGLAVSFPAGVTPAQADKWRESFDTDHAGVDNTARTKVVGNGATVTQIGMTQRDAQFIETVGMSLTDVALILSVPAWMLGVQEKATKPVSPEHEMQRFLYFHLAPRLAAIEAAINADTDMFGGADRFGFDTSDVVRGDLATEADISIRKVQAGTWLPDEARAKDGLPPLPDGVGQIPQVTPVGGAPNAKPPTNGEQ